MVKFELATCNTPLPEDTQAWKYRGNHTFEEIQVGGTVWRCKRYIAGEIIEWPGDRHSSSLNCEYGWDYLLCKNCATKAGLLW